MFQEPLPIYRTASFLTRGQAAEVPASPELAYAPRNALPKVWPNYEPVTETGTSRGEPGVGMRPNWGQISMPPSY